MYNVYTQGDALQQAFSIGSQKVQREIHFPESNYHSFLVLWHFLTTAVKSASERVGGKARDDVRAGSIRSKAGW